jgi:hypothetical protein
MDTALAGKAGSASYLFDAFGSIRFMRDSLVCGYLHGTMDDTSDRDVFATTT